jgi:hypothetical protein
LAKTAKTSFFCTYRGFGKNHHLGGFGQIEENGGFAKNRSFWAPRLFFGTKKNNFDFFAKKGPGGSK